jgi:hypothetical protein
LSPTLPLPPPDAARVTAFDAEQGIVTIEGGAGSVRATALVYGYNARLGLGSFTKASDAGAFSLEIKAELGDRIDLWAEYNLERSEPAVVTVAAPR